MQSHALFKPAQTKSDATMLTLGSYPSIRGYRSDQIFVFEGKELDTISISITYSNKLQWFGYLTKEMKSERMTFLSGEMLAKLQVTPGDAEIIKKVADGTEQAIQKILDQLSQLKNTKEIDSKKSSVSSKSKP